jgi:hypothetical protein
VRALDDDNPYRSPEARIAPAPSVAEPGDHTCWRYGHALLVLRDRPLPSRCIKCNADADGMREYGFSWVAPRAYAPLLLVPVVTLPPAVGRLPWLLWAIPLAFLCCLIANLWLRKRSRHALGLCARHRRVRRRVLGCASALLIAAVLSPWLFGGSFAGPVLPLSLFVLAVVIASSSAGRTLVPAWMDAHYGCFTECGEAFLQSLPEFPQTPEPASEQVSSSLPQ